MSKKKLFAAGKMIAGTGRLASGVITAAGKGAMGGICRQNGMITAARNLGRSSYAKGQKMIDEGIRDWHDADD